MAALAQTQQILLLDGDEEILKDIALKKEKMPLSRKIFIISMMIYQIVHFAIFFIYINFDSIIMAFQSTAGNNTFFVGFDNFKHLFNDIGDSASVLVPSTLNSLLLFAVNNFLILPISIFCAYIFFKKLPLANLFRIIFFLPSIISIVVLSMSFKLVLGSGGPLESLVTAMGGSLPDGGLFGNESTAIWMVCLYCLWAGIGYQVIFMCGAIQRIPGEVFESGQLDGVGMWKEMIYLVVPLIMPTVSTMFINGITVIFTIFLQPQLLLGAGILTYKGGTIAYYIISNATTTATRHYAAAAGLLFSFIGIPLVLGVKKLFDKITPDITF